MKTILILNDFSVRAANAAEFATHIAIKTKANIILCHAIELNTHLSNSMGFNWLPSEGILNDSKENLFAVGEKLEKLFALNNENNFKPTITYICEPGSLIDVTTNVLKEKKVDLIVSGSHQANGWMRFFFGSHGHAIMDNVNCPVLFIPECLKFNGIKTISYATDLSFNNTKALRFLTKFSTPFEAAIAVNHISYGEFSTVIPHQVMEYSLKKNLDKNHSAISYQCIKNPNVKEALLELIATHKIDMLTLVHKKYDFIENLLHQSVSKQLSGKAKVPLLVLPNTYCVNVADFSAEELEHFCYKSGDLREA